MSSNDKEKSVLLSLASDPSLIGRDLQVVEQGQVTRGPISKIEIKEDNYLEITVEWLARPADRIDANRHWALERAEPFTYGCRDNWAYAHRNDRDGSVHIGAPMSWSGDILADDTTRLVKPTT